MAFSISQNRKLREEYTMNRSNTMKSRADMNIRQTRRMTRLEFVTAAAATSLLAATVPVWAAETEGGMLYRRLGRTGEKVSAIGLGGYHIGTQKDEQESIRLVRSAIDRGITFMDNCWDYHDGVSEVRMGKALRGMVDDVDQLLGEQPYVDAMQDRAHRRHGKVGLQVFLVVPGEGADAVSRADAQLSQRGGQTAHAFAYLCVAGAPHMVAGVGRHLARRVDAFAVLEDAANGQREIGYGAAYVSHADRFEPVYRIHPPATNHQPPATPSAARPAPFTIEK